MIYSEKGEKVLEKKQHSHNSIVHIFLIGAYIKSFCEHEAIYFSFISLKRNILTLDLYSWNNWHVLLLVSFWYFLFTFKSFYFKINTDTVNIYLCKLLEEDILANIISVKKYLAKHLSIAILKSPSIRNTAVCAKATTVNNVMSTIFFVLHHPECSLGILANCGTLWSLYAGLSQAHLSESPK